MIDSESVINFDALQDGWHHNSMPTHTRICPAVLTVILLGGVLVTAIGSAEESRIHIDNPYLSGGHDHLAKSLINSPVSVERVDKKFRKVESERYSLLLDPTRNEPFLVFTGYDSMGGGQQVVLELFTDSRARTVWSDTTNLTGTYEGYIDDSQLQLILELLVRSGVVEPGGGAQLARLPESPDSPKLELQLRAESLAVKELGGTLYHHAPYENRLATPMVGCDNTNTSADAAILCRLKTLHNMLFDIALRLARSN